MEREYSRFSPELLQMMRDEEREKFVTALKNGASWGQLYKIRNTIKKLNEMINDAEKPVQRPDTDGDVAGRSGESTGPRDPSVNADE
ncbi:MAG TPA: hypothetical protein VGD17_01705 [Chitinophagaceae bacterium]